MEATNSSLVNTTPPGKLQQPSCGNQSDFTLPFLVELVLYSIVVGTSLLGNVLIISIIRTNQKLKAVTNYFILNLAVADILISLFGAGHVLVSMVIGSTVPPNILGTLVCKIVHPTAGVGLCGAILSLVVIAVDRFLAIRFPMQKISRLKTARFLILLIWLASLATCSPLIYASRRSTNYPGQCTEQWTPLFSANAPRVYTISFNILFYVIPLTLITWLYGAIIHKVWARQIPGQVTDANQRLENKTKRRVLKMLMTVVMVFAVCWLPINLTMVLADFGLVTCLPIYVISSGLLLGYSNAAINPLIYLLLSRDYRQGAIFIARKVFGCCGRPKLSRRARGGVYSVNNTGHSQVAVEMEMSFSNAAVITSYRQMQGK